MIELLRYGGEQTCDIFDKYEKHGQATYELIDALPSRDQVVLRLCDECVRQLGERINYLVGAKK